MEPKTPDLQSIWNIRMAQWRESGQSGLRWCREQNIKYSTFHYWKRRLGSHPMEEEGRFIEISSKPETYESSGVELELGAVRIHLQQGFDETTLCRVVTTLGRGL